MPAPSTPCSPLDVRKSADTICLPLSISTSYLLLLYLCTSKPPKTISTDLCGAVLVAHFKQTKPCMGLFKKLRIRLAYLFFNERIGSTSTKAAVAVVVVLPVVLVLFTGKTFNFVMYGTVPAVCITLCAIEHAQGAFERFRMLCNLHSVSAMCSYSAVGFLKSNTVSGAE